MGTSLDVCALILTKAGPRGCHFKYGGGCVCVCASKLVFFPALELLIWSWFREDFFFSAHHIECNYCLEIEGVSWNQTGNVAACPMFFFSVGCGSRLCPSKLLGLHGRRPGGCWWSPVLRQGLKACRAVGRLGAAGACGLVAGSPVQPYGCLHSAEVVRPKVRICPHVHGGLWELCVNHVWLLSGCKIFSGG